MRTLTLGGRCLAAMALAAMTAACDSSGSKILTTPSQVAPPSPGSGASLVISGPARMAPGQSALFTVNASPGTTIRWISSPPSFLQIDSSGLATAGPLSGGAAVTAEVTTTGPAGGVRAVSQGVLVMPDGTYILSGTVYDAEFKSTPVLDAHVEVTPGPLVTRTSGGYYRLYGVPPNAELRVTADGYQPSVQSLTLSGNATQNVELTVSGPRLDLAGAHTLTIDGTMGCSGSSLPADLQRRRYDAVVTQSGLMLEVSLTEPMFRLDGAGQGSRFPGRVTTTGVTFTLRGVEWDFDGAPFFPGIGPYPNLVERLANGTLLVVAGVAETTGSHAGVSGTLRGSLTNWNSGSSTSLREYCDAEDLRFTLTRR